LNVEPVFAIITAVRRNSIARQDLKFDLPLSSVAQNRNHQYHFGRQVGSFENK